MAILASLKRGLGRTQRPADSAGTPRDLIEDLRDEMTERATRHEILAAQRTDLVVDQLWRRLESADARLATALQQLEERVRVLERDLRAGAPASPPRDESVLLDE